ncbi:unnamed protein product, partial [Staurois parvus]
MTRDGGHSTGDDQRLQIQYRRCGLHSTGGHVQEMTRDCRHSIGETAYGT